MPREEKKASGKKTKRISPSKPIPSVAIIGAGRLGTALALALSQNGYRIAALVARRTPRARLAARAISPRPLALGASRLDSLPDTDIILITTPDDQIAEVATRLAQAFVMRHDGSQRRSSSDDNAPSSKRRLTRVVLHASGALASDALAPLGEHAFSIASLHPLISVSDAESGARNLPGAFYCLEGEARALREARRIVRALGGQSFSIAARDKSLYHAAAVITSGHTVALFSLATALLARCGLSETRARRVLLPLLASTLANLATRTPVDALTGTFARADLTTVRKHLAALQTACAPGSDALAIYALLGEHSLQLAARRRNKPDQSVSDEIARLLRRAVNSSFAK
jgi:predicted short-subunit dehydrogenase-like oxidoreductase (DUF2520 family)